MKTSIVRSMRTANRGIRRENASGAMATDAGTAACRIQSRTIWSIRRLATFPRLSSTPTIPAKVRTASSTSRRLSRFATGRTIGRSVPHHPSRHSPGTGVFFAQLPQNSGTTTSQHKNTSKTMCGRGRLPGKADAGTVRSTGHASHGAGGCGRPKPAMPKRPCTSNRSHWNHALARPSGSVLWRPRQGSLSPVQAASAKAVLTRFDSPRRIPRAAAG